MLTIIPNLVYLSSWEIREYLCISNLFWSRERSSRELVEKLKENSEGPILLLKPLALRDICWVKLIP